MSPKMSSLAVEEIQESLFDSEMSLHNDPTLYVITPRHLSRNTELNASHLEEVIKIAGKFTVSF